MAKAILETNYWCAGGGRIARQMTELQVQSAYTVPHMADVGRSPPLQYPCSEVSGFR